MQCRCTRRADSDLEYALETALAQTYVDFEIVISDNASTDGTEEICRRFVDAIPGCSTTGAK